MAIRYIKLGKYERKENWEVEHIITKETPKAMQITIKEKMVRPSGRIREEETTEWIPKSQILYQDKNYIAIPDWLAKQKELLHTIEVVVTLDSEELTKKDINYKVALIDETSEAAKLRIELLQQGLAKEQF
jgi:hypothetical protein